MFGGGGGYFDDDEDVPRKRPEEQFWEESDDEPPSKQIKPNDEESEDELDMFMKSVNAEASKQEQDALVKATLKNHGESSKPLRDDIEEDDEMESYLKFVKEKAEKEALRSYDDAPDEVEYDSDGNPLLPSLEKREIDPLPTLDHSKIEYLEFAKDFYDQHDEITALKQHEVNHIKRAMGARVTGFEPVRPITQFKHLGFDDLFMKEVAKQGFTEPTDIQVLGSLFDSDSIFSTSPYGLRVLSGHHSPQKLALPVALNGRDVVGVAATGSGKTYAYAWPMLIHILDQPYLEKGDGPIALVLAPTRELVQQIHVAVKKFAKLVDVRVCSITGGAGKYEQFKELKAGVEVVIATPGRLIDLVKMKGLNFLRTTFLVLDEADRMFSLGFEPQVRSIVNQVRPDRQTLFFSATFRPKIEKLTNDILTDPIRITIGETSIANKDIVQVVEILENESQKIPWLLNHVAGFVQNGQVLIFTNTKGGTEEVAADMIRRRLRAGAIHGDMRQNERDDMMNTFKSGEMNVLVATDIAARGLDIKGVRTVINFMRAKDIESHIHRVGRTGRAGEKGVAYTILTPQDATFAAELVRHLESCEQSITPGLMELAKKSPRFGKILRSGRRGGRGGGRGRGRVVSGIGFQDSSQFPQNSGNMGAQGNTPGFVASTTPTQPQMHSQSGYLSQFQKGGQLGGEASQEIQVLQPLQQPPSVQDFAPQSHNPPTKKRRWDSREPVVKSSESRVATSTNSASVSSHDHSYHDHRSKRRHEDLERHRDERDHYRDERHHQDERDHHRDYERDRHRDRDRDRDRHHNRHDYGRDRQDSDRSRETHTTYDRSHERHSQTTVDKASTPSTKPDNTVPDDLMAKLRAQFQAAKEQATTQSQPPIPQQVTPQITQQTASKFGPQLTPSQMAENLKMQQMAAQSAPSVQGYSMAGGYSNYSMNQPQLTPEMKKKKWTWGNG